MRGRFAKTTGSPGVASVEFALVMPVLFLIVLATGDYGNFLQQNLRLEGAARAGAQIMMTQPDNAAQIRAATLGYLGGWEAAPADCSIGTTAGVCVASGTRCQLIDSTANIPCGDVPAETDFRRYAWVTVTRPYSRLFIVPQETLIGNVEIRLR